MLNNLDLASDPQIIAEQIIDILIDTVFIVSGDVASKTNRHSISDVMFAVNDLNISVGKTKIEKEIKENIKIKLNSFAKNYKDAPTTSYHNLTSVRNSLRLQGFSQAIDQDNSEDGVYFSLTDKDRARVMELCSEIRHIVSKSAIFDDPHKRRIFNRISQIEKEVYKKIGNFDTILGGIVDAGEAFGRFGSKSKPIFDRIREIRNIAQKSSKGYEELPSPEDLKRLPPPSDDDSEET